MIKGVLPIFFLIFVSGCTNESMEPIDQLKSTAVKAIQNGKLNFTTSLKGANEVPSVDSKAAGQASVKISKDGTSIYLKLTAANIENVRAAHLHLAPEGANVGVVAFLFSNPNPQPSGPQNGVLSEGIITESEVIGSLAGDLQGLIDAIQARHLCERSYGAASLWRVKRPMPISCFDNFETNQIPQLSLMSQERGGIWTSEVFAKGRCP